MAPAMIEADDLSKYYGDHKAIDGISFSISEGEIVGLLGLNGAGKSTILKVLGCFLLPSKGSASVGGFAVDEQPDEIRRIIGYLPDTPPLYDEMTVDRYLSYVAKLKNVSSNEVSSKVGLAKEKTNLGDVADACLGELSHGFRQRVGIAQALVHNPKVLILDEPINGLDPVQIVEMRDLIVSLKGHHTVVLSSHILSEITKTCDRVLIIDEGRLIAEGAEADLQASSTGPMHIHLDLDASSNELVQSLEKISGVSSIEESQAPMVACRLTVHTESDLRAELARTVIGAGVGLVGMQKGDTGLESVFMKMINAQGGQR